MVRFENRRAIRRFDAQGRICETFLRRRCLMIGRSIVLGANLRNRIALPAMLYLRSAPAFYLLVALPAVSCFSGCSELAFSPAETETQSSSAVHEQLQLIEKGRLSSICASSAADWSLSELRQLRPAELARIRNVDISNSLI